MGDGELDSLVGLGCEQVELSVLCCIGGEENGWCRDVWDAGLVCDGMGTGLGLR